MTQVEEDMEQMKIEKEMVVNENTKVVDDRQRLETTISVACEEIPDITTEMFTEAKVLRLGQIVAKCKHVQYRVHCLRR